MSHDSSRRLGRGLAALIGEMDKPDVAPVPAKAHDMRVPIEHVVANRNNPRRHFAEAELADLAQSIRAHGIVQPIVVRSAAEVGHYEIIAGERRWRAAQKAGLSEVPIIIREVSDRTALELAIVENVQRTDLNPVEEANGYQQLIDHHEYTQADLGQIIGRSRSHVANTLRLLKLPDSIQTMIVDGTLSAGHARTLVNAADPAGLARRIVEEGLSVRQAEALAQQPVAAPSTEAVGKAIRTPDADTVALERALRDATGLKVAIRHGTKGGTIAISYKSLEQLDDICRKLKP